MRGNHPNVYYILRVIAMVLCVTGCIVRPSNCSNNAAYLQGVRDATTMPPEGVRSE